MIHIKISPLSMMGKTKKRKQQRNNTVKHKREKKYKHKNHYHKRITDREFKKAKCAPTTNSVGEFTCYSDKALQKMRDLWNIRHPDCKIQDKSPREIWLSLRDYMGDVCDNEACWLKNKFIEQELDPDLLHYTFAPKKPNSWIKEPNKWLNSRDILNVMKQYERKYKCFEFLGPSPIDYDTHIYDGECVWKELCELDIHNEIKKGKNKIGIIFNLDPHYMAGSHWIAAFIHIKKGMLYYFDSYGEKPEPQVKKLFNTIKEQGKRLNIDFNEKINSFRHQYGDSECGMYCLHFIIEMLMDKNIDYFFSNRISDTKMLKLRREYFN